MIGGLVIAMVLGGAIEQPGVVWIDGAGLESVSVQIGERGEYAVWVKTAPGGRATLKVDSFAIELPAYDDVPLERVGWAQVGSRNLKVGTLPIECSGPIVRIALSNAEDFDPLSAEVLMYVRGYGDLPRDSRLDLVRDTDTVYAMTEFDSLEDWEAYAATLRRKMLVGSGLWPLPERTPLNAEVEDVTKHDDYIVSRVHFEAMPGFYVTGNLYRPTGEGPFPGVVCPHGHWEHGRLEHGERGSVPARGVTLARMGMVAFTYDMVGYNDSQQLKHRFDDQSEEERTRLELWGIHPFAVQLWSSMRVVDFLQSLSYVDADNIACTGASGGGTQTFALTSVDDRIKVAAPVNMISHSMQGGCICENAPLIRFNASNMEVGALAAPRPMMMISATGDWTRDTPKVEYPGVRSIYELYGAADRVASIQIDAPHNYNQDSREAVYRFFGKWVLGDKARWADFTEPEALPEPVEVARVFADDAELESGDRILTNLVEERRLRAQAALPKSVDELDEFKKGYGGALFDVTGVVKPNERDVDARLVGFVPNRPDYRVYTYAVRRGESGERIPALFFTPTGEQPKRCALVVHSGGKAMLTNIADGDPGPMIALLLAKDIAVLAIDPFLTGEQALLGQERTYGKFPTTFLPTDTGYRIQDIVTALAYLRSRDDVGELTGLIGLGDAGVWCLFASALDGNVPTTVADANGFDAGDDMAWLERHYMACVRSVGDVKTAAAMIAPRELAIFNTYGGFDMSGVTGLFGDALTLAHDDWAADRIAGQF